LHCPFEIIVKVKIKTGSIYSYNLHKQLSKVAWWQRRKIGKIQ